MGRRPGNLTLRGGAARPPDPSGRGGSPHSGVWAAQVPMTAGVRMGLHASSIVSVYGRTRSKRWLAASVASLAVDALIVAHHRRGNLRPLALQPLVDAADAVMWALGHDPHDTGGISGVLMPGPVSSGVSLGFDLAADTEAVPNVAAKRGASKRTAVIQAVASTLLPPIAVLVVQRRRGSTVPPAGWTWGPLGLVYGLALGRNRKQAQQRTREEWALRAERAEAVAWRAAQLAAATEATPGHDFKKTLLQIGALGSGPAFDAAREQADRPRRLIEATADGGTLYDIAFGLRIQPPAAGCLWLSEAQAKEVELFLHGALRDAEDEADPLLHAGLVPGEGIALRLLGSATTIENDAPKVQARLHPTAVGFLLSLAHALQPRSDEDRDLPKGTMAGIIALDVAGFARFWRRPPSTEELPLVLGIAAARAGLVFATCLSGRARTVSSTGAPLFPTGYALIEGFVMLGCHWAQLSSRQRLGLPALVLAWLAVTARTTSHTRSEVVAHLLAYAPHFFTQASLETHIQDEEALLEEQLARRFDQRMMALQLRAYRKQTGYYRAQLELAEQELETFGHLATPPQRAAIQVDLEELRAWLVHAERQRAS